MPPSRRDRKTGRVADLPALLSYIRGGRSAELSDMFVKLDDVAHTRVVNILQLASPCLRLQACAGTGSSGSLGGIEREAAGVSSLQGIPVLAAERQGQSK